MIGIPVTDAISCSGELENEVVEKFKIGRPVVRMRRFLCYLAATTKSTDDLLGCVVASQDIKLRVVLFARSTTALSSRCFEATMVSFIRIKLRNCKTLYYFIPDLL